MVRLAEQKVIGTFNAVGHVRPMSELLYGIKAVTTAGAQFTWVSAEFLAAQGVRGWRHMTVWLPPTGATAGFLSRNNARAVSKGLTFRPLSVTAADTLAWNKTRTEAELKSLADGAIAGLATAKEVEVLTAWKASQSGGPKND
jgi:2'-hydroxyisoflavone reductase